MTKMFYKNYKKSMGDHQVEKFFKRATGRKYTSSETSINDIRRLCATFWNEELKKRIEEGYLK